MPHWTLLNFGVLSRARKLNIPVMVWTVNQLRKIRRLLKSDRIEGIITDYPENALLLRQELHTPFPVV